MVENCGISSAGWCCSEMPWYCRGNYMHKRHTQNDLLDIASFKLTKRHKKRHMVYISDVENLINSNTQQNTEFLRILFPRGQNPPKP